MFKFLHLSDVHLGCRRYNLEERTKDFFRSWHDVITRHALPNQIDFMLIAGDFFDRRNIDPQTMNHALAGLQLLKEAGIPVVAIEGNHDRRDAVSPYSRTARTSASSCSRRRRRDGRGCLRWRRRGCPRL
ncbi:MAG TPA: DNA repair exonuclease [Pyrinomonadaceae bacterium]|nr:DNA repair exonuclease [Pyrinomonadaceae bacterium]